MSLAFFYRTRVTGNGVIFVLGKFSRKGVFEKVTWMTIIISCILAFCVGLIVGKTLFQTEDKPVGVLKIIEEWNQSRDYEPQDPYFFLELEELPFKLTNKKTVVFRVDYRRVNTSSTQKKQSI